VRLEDLLAPVDAGCIRQDGLLHALERVHGVKGADQVQIAAEVRRAVFQQVVLGQRRERPEPIAEPQQLEGCTHRDERLRGPSADLQVVTDLSECPWPLGEKGEQLEVMGDEHHRIGEHAREDVPERSLVDPRPRLRRRTVWTHGTPHWPLSATLTLVAAR
jgi:hypothetical protein